MNHQNGVGRWGNELKKTEDRGKRKKITKEREKCRRMGLRGPTKVTRW